MKKCPECGKEVTGRSDKKFCSPYCKSSFHYEQHKQNESSLFQEIDRQLKQNRKILKQYNKAGKSTVKKSALIAEGFNPGYFTHYWKATNGNVYLFCYEYGFMKVKDHKDVEKYVLVQYQNYMKNKNPSKKV